MLIAKLTDYDSQVSLTTSPMSTVGTFATCLNPVQWPLSGQLRLFGAVEVLFTARLPNRTLHARPGGLATLLPYLRYSLVLTIPI